MWWQQTLLLEQTFFQPITKLCKNKIGIFYAIHIYYEAKTLLECSILVQKSKPLNLLKLLFYMPR